MTATNYATQAHKQLVELIDVALSAALNLTGVTSNVANAVCPDAWPVAAPSSLTGPAFRLVNSGQRHPGLAPSEVSE